MGEGIYVALSGALAQQTALETTATNLANASTDGYQRLRPVFREALAAAQQNGVGLHYTAVQESPLDVTPGASRPTGRGGDAALPAGAFLAVGTPRGERFTRGCSLSLGADGTVVTAHHDPVLGEDGAPLRGRAGGAEITLTADGQVRQGDAVVGRLRTVSFANPARLSPEGATLLAATPAAGAATPVAAQLQVGALEESNSQVVSAMTELVTATRTFEAFQRAIETFREADRKVVTSVASTT